MELRTEGLTDWGGDGRQFPGEPVDRMAETVAEARTREPCLDAFDRTVEAIGQDAVWLKNCTESGRVAIIRGEHAMETSTPRSRMAS